MNKIILPEGRYLETVTNVELCHDMVGLRKAYEEGLIVEGIALQCEEGLGVTVALGNFTGLIPWYEGALGMSEGLVRDIAIMSRIGRPVSVVITEIREERGTVTPMLSRSFAQELARNHVMAMEAGVVLPATVTRLEPFGAFVDIGCGLASLLSIDRISISRIGHPSQRFVTGQEIYVAILEHEWELKRVRVTHRELLGTWEENADLFSVGMTLPGVVRSIKNYGIFVELSPNFSGLAEYVDGYFEGQRVSVYIKGIVHGRMKCKLLIIGGLPSVGVSPIRYLLPEQGRFERWNYAPEGCVKPGSETDFREG